MIIYNVDTHKNKETTLLLNENLNFSNGQSEFKSRRVRGYYKYNRRIRKKRILLLISLSIIISITTILIGKSLFNKPNNPIQIKEEKLEELNNISFSDASKTYFIDNKQIENNTFSGEKKEAPLRVLPESEIKKKIFKDGNYKSLNYYGFYYCDETEGPITVDLNYDDSTKANLYTRLNKNQDLKNFVVYKYDKMVYNSLAEKTPSKKSIICEIPQIAAPESFIGYKLSCPKYYTLRIESVYFGLHQENDNSCKMGKYVGKDKNEEIEIDVTGNVEELNNEVKKKDKVIKEEEEKGKSQKEFEEHDNLKKLYLKGIS
ncbi:hypothetical protein PIROE2DRAFT_69428 [Piromyces sp. E2]|nr:hypothetical protein PIROE2DRAFT_69428 [Piromyces sp. E2]|eukprot:OUM63029.1 hypothetical protein PIROE2DRAFT_69428 [Piromyces sp. E2]